MVLPVFIPLLLWGARTSYLLVLPGHYNLAYGPSDLAFSGLSFDLWAALTIFVYRQPLQMPAVFVKADKLEGVATSAERFLLIFSIVMHLITFPIGASLAYSFPTFSAQVLSDPVQALFISFLVTYFVPILILSRIVSTIQQWRSAA